MTKFHLFSQDSVRLETAPTGGVRKSYSIRISRILAKTKPATTAQATPEKRKSTIQNRVVSPQGKIKSPQGKIKNEQRLPLRAKPPAIACCRVCRPKTSPVLADLRCDWRLYPPRK